MSCFKAFPKPLKRPKALKKGARIAAVSPSWGGPGTFPYRFEVGKTELEKTFEVELVATPTALADPAWLSRNPKARAKDLMQAFADPEIDAIFATIGGDDAIRLMPHLDLQVIADNPKIFLGFSDITSLHFACLAAGLAPFYGPSIMAGFAENGGMHAFTRQAVQKALFAPDPIGRVPENREGWTAEHADWRHERLQNKKRPLNAPGPVLALQGHGTVQGHLLGGCAEVLEMLKGTAWWPPAHYWNDAILFIETSEDTPPPAFARYWLRNYAAQGILNRLAGILIARADPGGIPDYQEGLEVEILKVLAENGLERMPVLSRLDFGHTQPMLTLPYGVRAELSVDPPGLILLEAATTR